VDQFNRSNNEEIMKMMTFLTLAGLLFVPASVLTQTQRDPCKGETTFEMKQCSAKKYKQADDELNKTYQQLMSKLDDDGHRTSLKTAQQAWLKYRDSNCDFESYLNRGGSIYSVIVTECMSAMTTSRTKELKEQIKSLDNL
jgi:uncharacterized protein YecT (DUF1311 family)